MADMQDKVRLPRLIAPKSLPENWRIIFERDPGRFIDLFAFNIYLAGQFDRKIPLEELRHAFRAWLEWHDKCTVLVATGCKPSPASESAQSPTNER